MAYKLLDPKEPGQGGDRGRFCAMAIMAKAPRAGKVKTRLSPPFTLPETAALNICFLRDTGETLASLSNAAPLVCYTPVGEEDAFDNLFPTTFSLIAQRGDGFGERLGHRRFDFGNRADDHDARASDGFGERLYAAAQDILACGYGAVCLIDSDSPTVPKAAFAQAVQALSQSGDRVVLGPSHDGGYYLIGLKLAHPEPFRSISWSTEHVATETRQRCAEAGIDLVELPMWYDIDDAATLAILEDELLEATRPPFALVDGSDATATRHFLQERRNLEASTRSLSSARAR